MQKKNKNNSVGYNTICSPDSQHHMQQFKQLQNYARPVAKTHFGWERESFVAWPLTYWLRNNNAHYACTGELFKLCTSFFQHRSTLLDAQRRVDVEIWNWHIPDVSFLPHSVLELQLTSSQITTCVNVAEILGDAEANPEDLITGEECQARPSQEIIDFFRLKGRVLWTLDDIFKFWGDLN